MRWITAGVFAATMCLTVSNAAAAVTAEDVSEADRTCVVTKDRYDQALATELEAARKVQEYKVLEQAAWQRGIPYMFLGDFAGAETHFRQARLYAAYGQEWAIWQAEVRAIATARFYEWCVALERYRLLVQEYLCQ